MKTLIVGQGYIGTYLTKELERIKPDVYDKYKNIDTRKYAYYDIAWLCLPTPYDTCEIDEILNAMDENKANIYVIKSTILPSRLKELKKTFVICPEYYGRTQDSIDTIQDYTIFGGNRKDCDKVIDSIKYCYNGNHKFIVTSPVLASLVKYMSNSFLLMKQTFCNEFYNIANKHNESYNELRELFLLDKQFSGMRTNVDESTMNMDHHCLSKDVPAIANEENNDLLKFISSYHQVSKK